MKTARQTLPVLLLLSLFVFVACAAQMTMSQRYLAASTEFTDTVKEYNKYYEAASPETQAKYREKYDPLILKADTALDLWKATLGTPDGATNENVFLEAKRDLFKELIPLLSE